MNLLLAHLSKKMLISLQKVNYARNSLKKMNNILGFADNEKKNIFIQHSITHVGPSSLCYPLVGKLQEVRCLASLCIVLKSRKIEELYFWIKRCHQIIHQLIPKGQYDKAHRHISTRTCT